MPRCKVRHPSVRFRLESLEDRAVPATGTFVEDFTHDTRPARAQYDTWRDGLQIGKAGAFGASFVATPVGNPLTSPAAGHSLRLVGAEAESSLAQYSAFVYRTSESGGINAWETVTSVSVKLRGAGIVSFVSVSGNGISFTNSAPADEWVTFTVTPSTPINQTGGVFGQFSLINVNTRGEMLVDDLTVQVGVDVPTPPPDGAGVVRVHRFGNGLGIVGDAGNNLVQVDLLYDAAGTVRVSGPGLATKIIAGRGVTQIDEYTVEVTDFAHQQTFDNNGRPESDDRDILINLRGGDDQLIVAGADWDTAGQLPLTVDDLFITMSGGDSMAVLTNVVLWDALLYKSGGGQDSLGVFGKSRMGGLRVDTGGGNDDVQLGTPGARVLDGEFPGDLRIATEAGEGRMLNWVNTGGGNDKVLVSGGIYGPLSFNLGSGGDTLRFESVQDLYVNGVASRALFDVRPGSGSDQVDVIESIVYIDLYQDADDTVRFHRFAENVISLKRKTNGIRIKVPLSGTQYLIGSDLGDIPPGQPGGLKNFQSRFFADPANDEEVKLQARSIIEYASGDF